MIPGMLGGPGLFTGRTSSVRFVSRAPGAGPMVRRITFDQRADLGPDALLDAVSTDTAWVGLPAHSPALRAIRNTTLMANAGDGARVPIATVEHALSALAGTNRWDACIEVEGLEVPILDGSALDFARALLEAAPVGTRRAWTIAAPLRVEDPTSGASIVAHPPATPADSGTYSYVLEYPPGSGIPPQRASWRVGDIQGYLDQVAPARTFSPRAEAQHAEALGLFGAFSPRDLLVLDDHGQAIDNTLRYPDEPARHKLLDLIGDLALLGRPLRADVVATRSGHALAHAFCREVRRQGMLEPARSGVPA